MEELFVKLAENKRKREQSKIERLSKNVANDQDHKKEDRNNNHHKTNSNTIINNNININNNNINNFFYESDNMNNSQHISCLKNIIQQEQK